MSWVVHSALISEQVGVFDQLILKIPYRFYNHLFEKRGAICLEETGSSTYLLVA